MKKTVALLSLICLFAACKTPGGDPQKALESFLTALGNKDLSAAKKWVTKDSEPMINMLEMGMKMAPDSAKVPYDRSQMTFGKADIDGNTAHITAREKGSGEEIVFTLKKENNEWKVAFDKATIMRMATDKMKEKGIDPSTLPYDSMKLPSMNTDSVKERFKNMSPEDKKAIRRELDSAAAVMEEFREEGKLKF